MGLRDFTPPPPPVPAGFETTLMDKKKHAIKVNIAKKRPGVISPSLSRYIGD